VTEGQIARVGGKAANLAEMMRQGFPMPAGFCLTTAAFDEFLAACSRREELRASLAQAASGPASAIASASQNALDWLAETDLPPVIVGPYNRNAPPPPALAPDGQAQPLQGVGISPGVATGRARAILQADSTARVWPGEILVAPYTDPGWTPYFLPAAGIVVDIGGLLSHGSVVAREYGLPAVVNVVPATQIIRTGGWVRVDGSRGQVTILERAGPTP
jgi:pyruvate,water dikinase